MMVWYKMTVQPLRDVRGEASMAGLSISFLFVAVYASYGCGHRLYGACTAIYTAVAQLGRATPYRGYDVGSIPACGLVWVLLTPAGYTIAWCTMVSERMR